VGEHVNRWNLWKPRKIRPITVQKRVDLFLKVKAQLAGRLYPCKPRCDCSSRGSAPRTTATSGSTCAGSCATGAAPGLCPSSLEHPRFCDTKNKYIYTDLHVYWYITLYVANMAHKPNTLIPLLEGDED
jgi:hypothetical protein